jgi:hypothetical protein
VFAFWCGPGFTDDRRGRWDVLSATTFRITAQRRWILTELLKPLRCRTSRFVIAVQGDITPHGKDTLADEGTESGL